MNRKQNIDFNDLAFKMKLYKSIRDRKQAIYTV